MRVLGRLGGAGRSRRQRRRRARRKRLLKFDRLDQANQKAIREAAAEVQPVWRETVAQRTEQDRQFCAGRGMQIDATNFTAFHAAMTPVYGEFRDRIGADLVQQVLQATQA